jgi:ABC-type dipeptide/oligopeptide/nickel transport system ATPase component
VTDNARRADIVAVMGATGSGKSSTIRAALAADDGPRRLIYDPGDDYGDFGDICPSIQVVYDRMVKAGAGPFRLVFRPPFDLVRARAEFSRFCLIAYCVCAERGDVLIVVDELGDVTLPNWAPPGWAQLIRKGRKHGARIIAASQRPASIEKSIWSMATVVQSGRLNYLDDARTVARVLMVDPLEVVALPQLAWIRRSIYEPAVVRGRIEWRAGAPLEVIISKKPLPGAAAP